MSEDVLNAVGGADGSKWPWPDIDLTNAKRVAYTGSAGTSISVDPGGYVLIATSDCYVKWGSGAQTPDGNSDDELHLPQKYPFGLTITGSDTQINAIRAISNGTLHIYPCNGVS